MKDHEISFGKEWTLWEAELNVRGRPPILIIDECCSIKQGRDLYPLQLYQMQNPFEYAELWDSIPPTAIKKVQRILENYTILPKKFDPRLLLQFEVLYQPAPRLTEPEVIKTIDWANFIENELMTFRAKKDPRLQLIFKATLLRGIQMEYNPHAFLSTGSGTGKTLVYEQAGIRMDKVTSNSFLGTRTQRGSSEGLVQDQSLPICIEQLESQDAPNILHFMLSFMELGKGKLSTAYGSTFVEGQCTIIVTSNPTGYTQDRAATFRNLINALGSNYALGRRIGLIVYGGEGAYKKVESLDTINEDEWRCRFELFRAIEEYVFPCIERLFKTNTVKLWLDSPIEGYQTAVSSLIKQIEDKSVKEFLDTHGAGANKHIRGGALNCAIVDVLPELIPTIQSHSQSSKETIDVILQKADNYLNELIRINLESISNILETYEKEWQMQKIIFDMFPKYLKNVIRAIKAYKDNNTNAGVEVNLSSLKTSFNQDSQNYWSTVENNLSNCNIEKHNEELDKYFGFRVVKKAEEIWSVVFTDAGKTINITSF
jgi:hypothetical protein